MNWSPRKRQRIEKIVAAHSKASLEQTVALLEKELKPYFSMRMSQPPPTGDPFEAIRQIIDATVLEERPKRILLHNLDLFHAKLKEAQRGH